MQIGTIDTYRSADTGIIAQTKTIDRYRIVDKKESHINR